MIGGDDRSCILETLPHVIIALRKDGVIVDANAAAEAFFEIGKPLLIGQTLERLLPFGSSLLTLVGQVRERGAAINEYKIDLGRPGPSGDRSVDVHCAPLAQSDGGVLVVLQERTIADKIDRQLTHQGAARSVSGLAAMLAHEIKNPLSGIRGAAQLLETGLGDEDRALTRLICDETDRIVRLVDRMEVFSDQRPLRRDKVNIHTVLDHVKQVARNGFARHIRFAENYDPSLPPLAGNRDQLVQAFPEPRQKRRRGHWRRGGRRDRVVHRLPPRRQSSRSWLEAPGRAAAGISRLRQWPRRARRHRRTFVRTLRHH